MDDEIPLLSDTRLSKYTSSDPHHVRASEIASRGAGNHKIIWNTPLEEVASNLPRLEPSKIVLDKSKLCDGCQKIDFDSICAASSNTQYKVWNLDHVYRTSDCGLCSFLVAIADLPDPNQAQLQLYTVSARRVLSCRSNDLEDIVLFTVQPETTEGRTPASSGKKSNVYFVLQKEDCPYEKNRINFRNTTEYINWDVLRKWTDFCDDQHLEICDQINTPSVPGLVVIDCESRRLQKLPCSYMPYLTMSYVWGNSEFVDVGHDAIPNGPQLIEDAFQVVKSLGFKYLWIDRYCIPQNNIGEKHRLIRDMGRIYQNAYLTLIAAAGEDPTYGLPGVSVVPRWKPTPLNVESMTFMPVRTDLYTVLANSKWNTRGWTYQEALLSRRLLVFTEAGAYFQCKKARLVENVTMPPELWNTFSFGDEPLPGRSNFFPVVKDPFEYIEKCIRDFCGREFTYDGDVLDAFRGILETFKDMPEPVQTFAVSPFLTQSYCKAILQGQIAWVGAYYGTLTLAYGERISMNAASLRQWRMNVN